MSSLIQSGRVEGLLLGVRTDTHVSTPVESLEFATWGIQGDKHQGHRRKLTVRDQAALALGFTKEREVFNTRQWSAISTEEINEIAERMGVSHIPRGLLGENIIVSGMPGFSLFPAGTQFFFKDGRDVLRKVILYVSEENLPCGVPAQAIQEAFPEKTGLKTLFARHAQNRRGLVGFVLAPGLVERGDKVFANIPTQHLPM